MAGSHETPFKMKGSGHYGLGNSSPMKKTPSATHKHPHKKKSTGKLWRELSEADQKNINIALAKRGDMRMNETGPYSKSLKEDYLGPEKNIRTKYIKKDKK